MNRIVFPAVPLVLLTSALLGGCSTPRADLMPSGYRSTAAPGAESVPAPAPAPALASQGAQIYAVTAPAPLTAVAVGPGTAAPAPLPPAQPLPSAQPLVVAAKPRLPLGPKSRGADVLRVQVLLERAHFSSGEMDGTYGGNLRHAVEGYQKVHQLRASGVVDGATWAALAVDQGPVLTLYTVSAADAAGPYRPVPADMAAKAKLPALGYANVAEALGERFHISPALLKRMNPGKDLGRQGEVLTVPNVADLPPLPKAKKILVDRSDGTLTLLDDSGTPFAQFPASTGSSHDPLPLGVWKVNGVAHNPTYQYNPKLFWDAKPNDAMAKVPPGPNNPVGVVWIELSKKHYGIHGTPEPSLIGKSQSHGCIRLTNWDAAAVAHAVRPGVAVLLQE